MEGQGSPRQGADDGGRRVTHFSTGRATGLELWTRDSAPGKGGSSVLLTPRDGTEGLPFGRKLRAQQARGHEAPQGLAKAQRSLTHSSNPFLQRAPREVLEQASPKVHTSL